MGGRRRWGGVGLTQSLPHTTRTLTRTSSLHLYPQQPPPHTTPTLDRCYVFPALHFMTTSTPHTHHPLPPIHSITTTYRHTKGTPLYNPTLYNHPHISPTQLALHSTTLTLKLLVSFSLSRFGIYVTMFLEVLSTLIQVYIMACCFLIKKLICC